MTGDEARDPADDPRSEGAGSVRRPELWKRLVGMVVSGVCLAYFAASIWQQKTSLLLPAWSPDVVTCFALALVLATGALFAVALLWGRILAALGARPGLASLISVAMRSHLGKYLPGNFGQYLARLALGKASGLGLRKVGASLVLEVAVLALAAVIVGLSAFLLGGDRLLIALIEQMGGSFRWRAVARWAVLLALGVVGILVARFLGRDALGARHVDVRMLLAGGLFGLTFFVLEGLALGWVLLALDLEPSWRLLPSLFALAWLPGFLAPGVPGGLGIREALLSMLLTPCVGAAPALSATVLMRLLTVLAEVVGFVLGALLALRSSD